MPFLKGHSFAGKQKLIQNRVLLFPPEGGSGCEALTMRHLGHIIAHPSVPVSVLSVTCWLTELVHCYLRDTDSDRFLGHHLLSTVQRFGSSCTTSVNPVHTCTCLCPAESHLSCKPSLVQHHGWSGSL